MKQTTKKLAYVGKTPGSIALRNEWFTPHYVIDSARYVLGRIDLDPFSHIEANKYIKATYYFDKTIDAFKQNWRDYLCDTVWMNPPYSTGIISKAINKFIYEYSKPSFESAIVIVNSATDTKWYHKLLKHSDSMCFTLQRINFNNIDGKNKSANTKGQTFFYFGSKLIKFEDEFKYYGAIIKSI